MESAALAAALLPVLDLQGGQVVHAVRGERHRYRPLVSRLTPSSQPLAVAAALRRHGGFTELYLADLDALQGGPPDYATYAALTQSGFQLWIDVGIRSPDQARKVQQLGAAKLILALETLPTPELLTELLAQLDPAALVFSLDLRQGVPQRQPGVWPDATPEAIATAVIALRIRHLILLDVAQVGTGQGTGTLELCRRLHECYPEVTLLTGGGLRTRADVAEQLRCGASRVLVATALHEGLLP